MRPVTLPEALRHAADGPAGICLVDEHGESREISHGELLHEAAHAAGGLARLGLRRGDRVGIVEPDAGTFLRLFFGAAWAGMIPVPLAPPLRPGELPSWVAQLARLAEAARLTLLVAPSFLRPFLGQVQAACPSLRAIVEPAAVVGGNETADAADSAEGDVALIQLTSGSTGRPKGVAITHGNIAANTAAITEGLRVGPEDVGVSWLPLHHDMGLVGMVLAALYGRTRTVLLPPVSFLKRPASWLAALARHGGTISFAPNFAYALCARRVSDADLEGLDLSRWRVAGCGAEPVRADDLRAFARRLAPAGFSASAFLPCYGMAEHTLAVTFPPVGRGLAVSPAGHVACGRPFPGHALKVVDERGGEVPDGVEGEILLSGPSVMRGYDRPDGQPGEGLRDGWLATGDRGFLHDGELYVCGRTKDLVIVHGRKVHAHEVEQTVEALPGVRRGGVAAFGVGAFGPDGERVVLLAEARIRSDAADLATAIRRAVADGFGLRVHDVVILPPGTLPKTSSGKLRRAHARDLYATGKLARSRPSPVALARLRLASGWGYVTTGAFRAVRGLPA